MDHALKTRILIVSSIIVLLSLSNIWLSEIPNFSPIAAMAVFGGPFLNEKKIGLLIPLGALFLSDLFIGFHGLVIFTWGSVILIGLITIYFKSSLITRISGALIGAFLFFLITNFGVWTLGSYGYDIKGLITCYILAIPFFTNTIISTFLFSSIIEGLHMIFKKNRSLSQ